MQSFPRARLRRRSFAGALAAFACAPSFVRAQGTGHIRILVVYPPGGLSDHVARALGERLAVQMAVPARIENIAGGGGRVGLQALARAAPDGRTLAFSAISPLAVPLAEGGGGLDGLEPVAAIMETPVLLVGTPAFAGIGFADLLARARRQPGALRWATSGTGTAGHLLLERIGRAAGVEFTHVPYKGGRQQLTDALAGHFELLSTNLAEDAVGFVREGRFKPLVITGSRRAAALPAVPTLAEAGLPQADVVSLFGLFAPPATPASLLDALHRQVRQAAAHASVASRLEHSHPSAGSRADFTHEIARQAALNGARQR